MATKNEISNVKKLPVGKHQRMVLDETAIAAARRSLDQGAVTPGYGLYPPPYIRGATGCNTALQPAWCAETGSQSAHRPRRVGVVHSYHGRWLRDVGPRGQQRPRRASLACAGSHGAPSADSESWPS